MTTPKHPLFSQPAFSPDAATPSGRRISNEIPHIPPLITPISASSKLPSYTSPALIGDTIPPLPECEWNQTGATAMNNSETIEQAQEVVERIASAGSRNEADYGHIFARGWLGALLLEQLIDKDVHDRLLAEATANVAKVSEKA